MGILQSDGDWDPAKDAKCAFEQIIIFVNPGRTAQRWQWVRRERGKPAAFREYDYTAGQSGDHLLERLQSLVLALDDEATGIGILGVTSRVRKAFDVERVTNRFYERFRTELTTLGKFIEGITAQGDRDWYASLMLNRMMFVYFIQKQGFLDEDNDYLRNRLQKVQALPVDASTGSGQTDVVPALPSIGLGRTDVGPVRPELVEGSSRFQQFYRLFLLRLFHEGLGQPEAQRAPELADLLGKVPFLNGGLFDVHDLERDNPNISIPDTAFERVFDFFDAYRWRLDERPHREDNEINPDVLGYIFEKYVNQKQMGAYYTKEDITGYISRNTVIPFLFDAAKKECPVAFGPDGGVWRLLQEDPVATSTPPLATASPGTPATTTIPGPLRERPSLNTPSPLWERAMHRLRARPKLRANTPSPWPSPCRERVLPRLKPNTPSPKWERVRYRLRERPALRARPRLRPKAPTPFPLRERAGVRVSPQARSHFRERTRPNLRPKTRLCPKTPSPPRERMIPRQNPKTPSP